MQVAMYLQAGLHKYAESASTQLQASEKHCPTMICMSRWPALQQRSPDVVAAVLAHHPVVRNTSVDLKFRMRNVPRELHPAMLRQMYKNAGLDVPAARSACAALVQLPSLRHVTLRRHIGNMIHEEARAFSSLQQLESLEIVECVKPSVGATLAHALVATRSLTQLQLAGSPPLKREWWHGSSEPTEHDYLLGTPFPDTPLLHDSICSMTQLRDLALVRLPLQPQAYCALRDSLTLLTRLDLSHVGSATARAHRLRNAAGAGGH